MAEKESQTSNPQNIRASRMRAILRKYIPPGLIDYVREAVDQELDSIPNRKSDLTFLFADLVSFTSFSESRTPDEVVQMLNLSIGATSSVIHYWNGKVNKFMGDSIFATFEEPIHAVIAGIEMQKQFQIMNLIGVKDSSEEIKVRIGIHSGPCLLASIGTEDYMDFTAIGDSVNIAARLEKACRPGAVLASIETAKRIGDQILIQHQTQIEAKGKSSPIDAAYIDRIRYESPKGVIETGLDDELF